MLDRNFVSYIKVWAHNLEARISKFETIFKILNLNI